MAIHVNDPDQTVRRSKAWIYYGIFTVLAVIAGFSHPWMLLVALLTGCYSAYLYRGGRVVFWFW